MFSERETKCPRLKEKIYKPHGFYSIKNTVGKVLSLRRHFPARRWPCRPGARCAGGSSALPKRWRAAAAGPRGRSLPPQPRAVHTFRAASAQLGRCLFVSNLFFVCGFFFVVFLFCFLFFLDIPRMERETQTPPPPPMVSYCSFSERRSATGGKQRAGNHGVHKYMNHVVAGPAQQLLQHANGVLGLLPPRLCQSLGR